jgi:hypothetical protein
VTAPGPNQGRGKGPQMPPRALIVRTTTIVLAAIVLALIGYGAGVSIEDRNETVRTTPRFEPPVWAGQNFIAWCAGGFYARHESTIVIIICAHCVNP